MNTREKCIDHIIDFDGMNKLLSSHSIEKLMLTYKRGSDIDLSRTAEHIARNSAALQKFTSNCEKEIL